MKNKSNNKIIYVITTPGCEACKIMENIIKDMVNDNSDISLIISDYNNIPNKIVSNLVLVDFPTTIFVKDDEVVEYFTGTKSRSKVNKIIKNINF